MPGRQLEQEVWPANGCRVPTGQEKQKPAPLVSVYCPGLHRVHSLRPAAENCPALQLVHTEAPITVLKVPATQALHDVSPVSSLYRPAVQASHVRCPTSAAT